MKETNLIIVLIAMSLTFPVYSFAMGPQKEKKAIVLSCFVTSCPFCLGSHYKYPKTGSIKMPFQGYA
nr:hypothetical protein [Desulfobacterales bacterium]